MKKKIKIILIFSLFIIFSGFIYIYSNESKTITSNPYVNKKYDFSFSYPETILLKTGKTDKSELYLGIYKKEPDDQIEGLTIGGILVQKISNQEYINKWKNLKDTKFFSQDTIKRNGLLWTTATSTSFFNTRIVSLEKNGFTYALVLSSPLNNDDIKNIYQSVENNFIDTFKFEEKK